MPIRSRAYCIISDCSSASYSDCIFAFVWWAALIVCPLSYTVAYLSHEMVEGNSNKPYATRPLWSIFGFFRMLALDLTGQLRSQTARLTPEHFAAEHP
jgi:hypothetical protein